MKNQKYNKLILVTLFALMVQTSLFAQTGHHCDTCTYTVRLNEHLDSVQTMKTFNDYPNTDTSYYSFCDSTPKRNVAFVHGLGGSNNSWPKQVDYTINTGLAASFAVDYGGYESSFIQVGIQLKNELNDKLGSGINDTFPNRCKKQDYVIAHSQGGVACRYLDYKWDVGQTGSFGARNFYGLVTFGSPHGGAHIGLSQDEHAEFAQQMVSTIVLNGVNKKVYDLTDKFGPFVGAKLIVGLNDLDGFIENNLIPMILEDSYTGTMEEMKPGSPTMNAINSHTSKLHRAAFFGIEDAPECWRVVDNMLTKEAADYPLWGAQPDEDFKNKVEKVRLTHIDEIAKRKADIKRIRGTFKIPFYGVIRGALGGMNKLRGYQAEKERREEAVTFLNNANTQWRYLIGSYHRDSFERITKPLYYELTWEQQSWFGWTPHLHIFATYQGALDYFNLYVGTPNRNMHIQLVSHSVKVRSFFPSDGVILAKSQKAYPKVRETDTDKMEHNNHFQERNSSETKRILEDLYDGGTYDDFFKLEP